MKECKQNENKTSWWLYNSIALLLNILLSPIQEQQWGIGQRGSSQVYRSSSSSRMLFKTQIAIDFLSSPLLSSPRLSSPLLSSLLFFSPLLLFSFSFLFLCYIYRPIYKTLCSIWSIYFINQSVYGRVPDVTRCFNSLPSPDICFVSNEEITKTKIKIHGRLN